MSLPLVKDFFSNKVTIQLKNGHKFQGLLSQINYKNQTVLLEDVEDLGNSTDKNFIPHDKKIVEKIFQGDNIEEIMFKQKHFCEPKKYNKDEFWDAISEPVAQQQPKHEKKSYGNNNERHHYQQKRNYENRDNRDNRDNRGGRRDNYNKNYQNNYKNYQQKNNQYKRRDEKPERKQREDDRDYR